MCLQSAKPEGAAPPLQFEADRTDKEDAVTEAASLTASKNGFGQAFEFCVVEWLMETRHLPVPFRY